MCSKGGGSNLKIVQRGGTTVTLLGFGQDLRFGWVEEGVLYVKDSLYLVVK